MPDSLEPFRPTWGNASKHDPERYEAHLCESCLFRTLRVLCGERMVNTMFDEGPRAAEAEFSLVQITQVVLVWAKAPECRYQVNEPLETQDTVSPLP
ncbi:hypothetical protein D9M70_377900 [compost metagenome]